jgi:hypothetical protein
VIVIDSEPQSLRTIRAHCTNRVQSRSEKAIHSEEYSVSFNMKYELSGVECSDSNISQSVSQSVSQPEELCSSVEVSVM